MVIIDGKKMRHGGVEMDNAVNSRGQFLGGVLTQDKSNEIPAARRAVLPGCCLCVECQDGAERAMGR